MIDLVNSKIDMQIQETESAEYFNELFQLIKDATIVRIMIKNEQIRLLKLKLQIQDSI